MTKKGATPIEHSERGPSTAKRWRLCPASVIRSRGLPDEAGIEAAFGTVFHEFAAWCLHLDVDPQVFVGTTMGVKPHGSITFDQEMADKMRPGLDYFRSFIQPGVRFFVERRVSLERWVGPGEFGTADLFAFDLEKRHILGGDWKWGQGVPVQPKDNDQTILYLLGVWDEFGEEIFGSPKGVDVTICIEQPRAPGGGGLWHTTMEHLIEVGKQIRIDADLTLDPNAPANPSKEACEFCRAAKHNACADRTMHFIEAAGIDFDEIDNADVWTPLDIKRPLTPEQRTRVYNSKGQIIAMLEQLGEEMNNDLKNGNPVPGKKLVPGRHPSRKWNDEERAAKILTAWLGKTKAHKTPVILSPADVEKLVGKASYRESYARHVDTGTPKLIMANEDDPRESFGNVTDEYPEPDETDATTESLV